MLNYLQPSNNSGGYISNHRQNEMTTRQISGANNTVTEGKPVIMSLQPIAKKILKQKSRRRLYKQEIEYLHDPKVYEGENSAKASTAGFVSYLRTSMNRTKNQFDDSHQESNQLDNFQKTNDSSLRNHSVLNLTRYNQQTYLDQDDHQQHAHTGGRLSPIKSTSNMESTLSKIMKENGGPVKSNSNPLIALLAGDDQLPTTDQLQDPCGMLFPTTLVQETLEYSAHRKLSLLDRLLGKLKDGKDLKEHYVRLLLASCGGQCSAPELLKHDSRRDASSNSPPMKILDSSATKPDPNTVKRLIGLHPVHQVSEYTPEGIKEERLLKSLLLLQQKSSRVTEPLDIDIMKNNSTTCIGTCAAEKRSLTKVRTSGSPIQQLITQSCSERGLGTQSPSVLHAGSSDIHYSSFIQPQKSYLSNMQSNLQASKAQQPPPSIPSASCLSCYLPKHLADSIHFKCRERMHDFTLRGHCGGGTNSNRVVQMARHHRIVAGNLSSGALLSYNEQEIATKRKIEKMNQAIRERNSSNKKQSITDKSHRSAIDAISRNLTHYKSSGVVNETQQEISMDLNTQNMKQHKIRMPHAVIFSSIQQNTLNKNPSTQMILMNSESQTNIQLEVNPGKQSVMNQSILSNMHPIAQDKQHHSIHQIPTQQNQQEPRQQDKEKGTPRFFKQQNQQSSSKQYSSTFLTNLHSSQMDTQNNKNQYAGVINSMHSEEDDNQTNPGNSITTAQDWLKPRQQQQQKQYFNSNNVLYVDEQPSASYGQQQQEVRRNAIPLYYASNNTVTNIQSHQHLTTETPSNYHGYLQPLPHGPLTVLNNNFQQSQSVETPAPLPQDNQPLPEQRMTAFERRGVSLGHQKIMEQHQQQFVESQNHLMSNTVFQVKNVPHKHISRTQARQKNIANLTSNERVKMALAAAEARSRINRTPIIPTQVIQYNMQSGKRDTSIDSIAMESDLNNQNSISTRNKSEVAQKTFVPLKSNKAIFGADSILQELENTRNQIMLNRTQTMGPNPKKGLLQRGKFPFPAMLLPSATEYELWLLQKNTKEESQELSLQDKLVAQNLNIQPVKIFPAQKKRMFRDNKYHIRSNSKQLSSVPTGPGNSDILEEVLMLGTQNELSRALSSQRSNDEFNTNPTKLLVVRLQNQLQQKQPPPILKVDVNKHSFKDTHLETSTLEDTYRNNNSSNAFDILPSTSTREITD